MFLLSNKASAFLLLTLLHHRHATTLVAAADDGWRSDLPWDTDLTSKLSPSASLLSTTPDNYLTECIPTFEVSWPYKTNHALINQPSGMCLPHLFCAFELCSPDPDTDTVPLSERLEMTSDVNVDTLYSDLDGDIQDWIEDTSNSNYNLPSKVLFPVVASDIIAAVNFAKTHGLELSVKNSGHSYTAASTKKNTLLLNMNQYTRYASEGEGSIIDCDADSSSSSSSSNATDLSDQPCLLSLAKGKPAVIRVGGGENWDKTYRAVKAANEALEDGYKYHIVGGAAGTVSPMGWTFQGGLAGNKGGRLFGFGVDQVVQLEMVLPNTQHVKFGPTEWEDVEGYDVPKTTKVSGVCRTNPEELDESLWTWADCPEDANINFDDLWFAVRGGGGGTWGVVLSVYLQLHDYLPYEKVTLNSPTCLTETPSEAQMDVLGDAYTKFLIYLLLDPAVLEMPEEHSNACGWPPEDTAISCYGEGSGQMVVEYWKGYISAINETLLSEGLSTSLINASYNCPTVEFYKDLGDAYTAIFAPSYPVDYPYAEMVPDFPYPGLRVTLDDTSNVIIPKEWVLSDIGTAITYLPLSSAQYATFGGRNMAATSDQSNALSQAHRDGGYMFMLPHAALTDEFYAGLFPLMYNTSNTTKFPGFIGSNHAGVNTMGPLKDDWTKACPLDWTTEERKEKCIPLQEAIYGTETLKRLEAIKEQIDPDYIFDCNNCIGNNRVKSAEELAKEKENETKSEADRLASHFLFIWTLFVLAAVPYVV